MTTISAKCPSCGGEVFDTKVEPASFNDFIGAICVGCKRPLPEDDIERQVKAIFEASIDKMLNGGGI